ncbi:MAG TPA: tRNA (adenosine(37)-N6)-threonylcarbamoyltransferase complex ATPase subunit type 1 TsaE [Bdellovibrionota bacterium]|nr:tRNA (adenosine(37)-N6)-threonylcarbamoyltransferase complex ATPase subunit type 1 TsaE [Bdellovibrionota bacterium]
MPSRTSKPRRSSRAWKTTPGCSETQAKSVAFELARELKAGDRVLLEGPLGAGKTTFARALLEALGVEQPPEGSPTFAIAHEYRARGTEVVHIDFYRLKHEGELEEAGIPAYFWERKAIVICEWLSSFPEFEKSVLESGRSFQIKLGMRPSSPDLRDVEIYV